MHHKGRYDAQESMEGLMSLIEELGVSLKDFVPGYSDHTMVHPRNDPPVVISKSLFGRA
jgi:hypothetical protein